MGSYARALLRIDAKNEQFRELKQLRKAQSRRGRQERRKGIARTIGRVAGAAFLGPAGLFVGDALSALTDFVDRSENFKVSKGKFNMSESTELNRQLSRFDRASNISNVTNLATTAVQAFTLGGGATALKESFGSGGGASEAFDILSNKDYWTKFGGPNGSSSLWDYFKNRNRSAIGDTVKLGSGQWTV